MSTTPALPPNHHAHMPGFTGLFGIFGAVSCLVGRKPDADLAIELTGAGAGDDVVDVGCGPGSAVRRVSKRSVSKRGVASVVGVDPAPMMLRAARLFGTRDKRYVQGTAEDLPLPDGSVSVVWTLASVHHWRDIHAGLAEILRILRPGGRFLAVERRVEAGATGLASHGWVDEQAEAFAAACRGAGFTEAQVGRHELAGGRLRLTVLART